ncbi:MAG: tetratricopeptide repeat protein [Thermoguttaceae bacterium]
MNERRDEISPWIVPLAVAIIVLVAAASFSNSFGGSFVFDDEGAIWGNRTIRQLWPIWSPLCPPKHGEPVTGRPVVNFSLAINYAIGGLRVQSYHATNLAIHVAAALLLFALLRRTFLLPTMRDVWGTAATPLALTIALLWAVHPLQTESVTYLAQRSESLVGLFYLLTLYALARIAASAHPFGWCAVAVLACLLGMATKEVMVSAPLVALLYDRTFLAGSFRGAWRRRRGLYLALAATWLPLAWFVATAGGRGGTAGFGQSVGCWAYLGTQFGAIVHYLRLIAWPSPLVFDYGVEVARTAAEIVPYAIVVTLLLVASLVALWRWPRLGFLGVCFFALLAPTSSIVPVATQTIAEHRMYLPLATVLIAATVGVYWACRRIAGSGRFARLVLPWLLGVAVVVSCATLGTLTFERNKDYRSELAIWQDTAAKSPRNARAHNNLGNAIAAEGRREEAIMQFQEALQWQPAFPEAHNNLGNALAGLGRSDEAIGQFRLALAARPDYGEAHNNLGSVLASRGQLDEAVRHLRRACEIELDSAAPHANLGLAMVRLGELDEAIAEFRKALAIQPESAELYFNLGDALTKQGRLEDARDANRAALQLADLQGKRELASLLRVRIASLDARIKYNHP